MILDSKRAIHLLIQHRDTIPPFEVVEQLLHTSKSCDKKYLLHQYLHALFETDIHAGKDYHDMQVFEFALTILSFKYPLPAHSACFPYFCTSSL